jgi:predicted  nucleic acid-binding Zn-ribbon protein
MILPHPIQRPATLAHAVAALAHATTTERACLDAVQCLAAAPPGDTWNRALTLGLCSAHQAVRTAALQACGERLQRFAGQISAQDELIDALLDYCLTDQDAQRQPVRIGLLEQIADILLANPFTFEHHRTRLLIRSRDIHYMAYQNDALVEAVVRLEQRFSTEAARSDVAVVGRLFIARRNDAYARHITPENTLCAFLAADRPYSPAQIEPRLLEAYRDLLRRGASKPRAARAAIENLRHWLAPLPTDAPTRRRLAQGLLGGEPADTTERTQAQFHARAGRVLLAGPEQPGDVLRELTYGVASVRPELAPPLLGLLAHLPTVRLRFEAFGAFLNGPEARYTSADVWDAAITVVEQLLTGADESADLLGSAPAASIAGAVHAQYTQQVHGDRSLRSVLRNLALDPTFGTSALRRRIWEALLRVHPRNPAERRALYAAVLADPAHELYLPTLAIGAAQVERELWPLIEPTLPQLIAPARDRNLRRERLRAVCGLFVAVRPLDTAAAGELTAPPLVLLALDDADDEVRRLAEQSLHTSGYTSFLAYERGRRAMHVLQGKEAALRTEIDGRKKAIVEQERQIAQAERDRDGKRAERINLETQVTNCTNNYTQETRVIQKKLEQLGQEAFHLQQELEVCAGRCTHAQSQVDRQQKVWRERADALKESNAHLQQLRDELKSLQDERRELNKPVPSEHVRQRIGQVLEQSGAVVNGNSLASYIYARLQQIDLRLATVGYELRRSNADHNNIKRQHDEEKAVLEQVQRNLMTEQAAYSATEGQKKANHNAQKNQQRQLESAHKQYERDTNPLNKQLAQLQAQLNKLESALQQARDMVQNERNALRTAESALRAVTAELTQLHAQLAALEGEMRAATRIAAAAAKTNRAGVIKQIRFAQSVLAYYTYALEVRLQ